MRWLGLLLLIGTAHAAAPVPVIDLDFTRSDIPPATMSTSRAASVTGFDCSSPRKLLTFGPDTPAIHLCDSAGHSLGMMVNQQRFIKSGWARDLTQVPVSTVQGWIPTNITAAINQTGIDLVANSASSITATANLGTICQPSVNTAASPGVLTAYMKRITGTGAVWMSMDAADRNPHWTPVNGLINSSTWTRVPKGGLLQSVNNPDICFRLDVSGDAVAVDYVNLENDQNYTLSGPTTPVLTTTNNFNIIPPDVITVPLTGVNPDNFTIVMKFHRPRWYGQSPVSFSARFLEVNDGTTQNTLQAYMQSSALNDLSNDDYATNVFYSGFGNGPKTRCGLGGPGGAQLPLLVPPYPDQSSVVAITYSTTGGLDITCNNGSGSGNSSTTPIPGPTLIPAGTLNTAVLGYSPATTAGLSGSIQRFQVYNGRLQTGTLTSILSRLDPAVPMRTPSYLLLKAGGKFTYNATVQPAAGPMQCNQC